MTDKKRSLVLVTVDCLRADHCGFHGYGKRTTPFLDALASESFVVPTAVIAGGPTYYSFPAMLASRMPLVLGRDVIGIAPGEETLATVLHDSGYATAAFSAANPYISARFGYEQGFDCFRDFGDYEASKPSSPESSDEAAPRSTTLAGKLNRALKSSSRVLGLSALYNELYFQYCARIVPHPVRSLEAVRTFPSARVLVNEAQSWLESVGDRPFFLWLHFMEPHSPYYPPQDAFQEFTGQKLSAARARYLNAFWNRSDLNANGLRRHRDEVVELYDAGILTADQEIARLATHLKSAGVWDDCIFVLTADHGEEFLEHGRRYHAPIGLAEEFVRVPLMIRSPGQSKKEVPATPFSHVHLAPTLLDMLDIPAPASFRGRSFWSNLRNGEAWNDLAMMECVYGCTNPYRAKGRMGARLLGVRDKRYKLVVRLAQGATEELYDLETDPHEKMPVAEADAREIRRRLLQAVWKELGRAAEPNVTARIRSSLRDFRYENGSAHPELHC